MPMNETGMLLRIAARMPHIRTIAFDDYVSAGRVGFLAARRTFDPDRGVSFSTYAWTCARHEMWRLFRREVRASAAERAVGFGADATAPDDHFALLVAALDARAREVLTLRYARQFTQQETADALGVSQPTVARIEHAALAKLRSYFVV